MNFRRQINNFGRPANNKSNKFKLTLDHGHDHGTKG